MIIKKALIIKRNWLDLILFGQKTFEIRSSNTNIRGNIALIESGSGFIVGRCNIIDSFELDKSNIKEILLKSCIENEKIIYSMYKRPFVWIIDDAFRYNTPIEYKHPKGAVIWVDIEKQKIIL